MRRGIASRLIGRAEGAVLTPCVMPGDVPRHCQTRRRLACSSFRAPSTAAEPSHTCRPPPHPLPVLSKQQPAAMAPVGLKFAGMFPAKIWVRPRGRGRQGSTGLGRRRRPPRRPPPLRARRRRPRLTAGIRSRALPAPRRRTSPARMWCGECRGALRTEVAHGAARICAVRPHQGPPLQAPRQGGADSLCPASLRPSPAGS